MIYRHSFQLCFRIWHQERPRKWGTHQLLVYTDDVNLRARNINTTEARIDGRKEAAFKANEKKTKVMSRNQTVGRNHNFMIANKSLENMAKLNHFGRQKEIKIFIHEEIKAF